MQHNHQYLPVALDSPTQQSPTQSNEALLYPSYDVLDDHSPEHRSIGQQHDCYSYYDSSKEFPSPDVTNSPVSSRDDATSVMVMTNGNTLSSAPLWLCAACHGRYPVGGSGAGGGGATKYCLKKKDGGCCRCNSSCCSTANQEVTSRGGNVGPPSEGRRDGSCCCPCCRRCTCSSCCCGSTNIRYGRQSKMVSSSPIQRKWEVFPGRNKFCCDGRIVMAHQPGIFYVTVGLIIITNVLFFVFDCPFLVKFVSPAIPAIGALLFLFVMSTLLHTSFSDPGIIPRATPEEALYTERQIEVVNEGNGLSYRPPPRTKEVSINGVPVKLKYCFTCKIFRPPRASHCSICDNCVERFDHHCPWVGNCVGKRNYRYFYLFLVSLASLCVFIFSCVVAHLVIDMQNKEDGSFIESVKANPMSVVEGVVCFLAVWSILGLAGFHTYLTTSNQTTNEDIKGSFNSRRNSRNNINPYGYGNVCLNCLAVLCGPVTPSIIDRRGVVTADYLHSLQHPQPGGTIGAAVSQQPYSTAVVPRLEPQQQHNSSHSSPVAASVSYGALSPQNQAYQSLQNNTHPSPSAAPLSNGEGSVKERPTSSHAGGIASTASTPSSRPLHKQYHSNGSLLATPTRKKAPSFHSIGGDVLAGEEMVVIPPLGHTTNTTSLATVVRHSSSSGPPPPQHSSTPSNNGPHLHPPHLQHPNPEFLEILNSDLGNSGQVSSSQMYLLDSAHDLDLDSIDESTLSQLSESQPSHSESSQRGLIRPV